MSILVTGGAGYIGSHTLIALIDAGYRCVVVDDLSNGSAEAVRRIEMLTGERIPFYQIDVADPLLLSKVFYDHLITGVIHFAGLKAVGESVEKPIDYYQVNLGTTLNLVRCMAEAGVFKLVFSSSATVYGSEAPVPYVEGYGRGITSNPYGTSKAMIEQVLEDVAKSESRWQISLLRYFNPIGAHSSGVIGEDPQGVPNNLMPFMAQVAVGRRAALQVFGGDYPTPDGTCRRDYLHVMDLAEGHVAALENNHHLGCDAINLGTGSPVSVLEMIHAFESVTNVQIPFTIVDKRAGDLPEFWADASKAKQLLGWQAKRSLEEMMIDTWNWQSKNPDGYR
ncbi:UDP-glucose 4-epimerase GalE [Marinobacterium sp. xm-d-564]|uniref:UDP-glucose 4-epimerase GalE n=1 Tax=Marinobacterium sp. xm-d-564 TaxID=2497742 RepID=UPI00156987EC|nr:UDP-glucose 4-epimerase GalE [Marinobacterium sp. xm-d-564]NRP59906.1 UDP-glucose 4-epimerase [Marinobacterium sp. xm-d-564]